MTRVKFICTNFGRHWRQLHGYAHRRNICQLNLGTPINTLAPFAIRFRQAMWKGLPSQALRKHLDCGKCLNPHACSLICLCPKSVKCFHVSSTQFLINIRWRRFEPFTSSHSDAITQPCATLIAVLSPRSLVHSFAWTSRICSRQRTSKDMRKEHSKLG